MKMRERVERKRIALLLIILLTASQPIFGFAAVSERAAEENNFLANENGNMEEFVDEEGSSCFIDEEDYRSELLFQLSDEHAEELVLQSDMGADPRSAAQVHPEPKKLHAALIMIRFSNEPQEATKLEADVLQEAVEESKAFFKDASYGKSELEVTYLWDETTGTYSYLDPHTYGYYMQKSVLYPEGYTSKSEGLDRKEQLLRNAVEAMKQYLPAGAELDSDDNGLVDAVIFYLAMDPNNGTGGAPIRGSTYWPHRSYLRRSSGSAPLLGEKKVFDYVVLSAATFNQADTISHELVHVLGAPDFYDTKSNHKPVGLWDCMSENDIVNPIQHPTVYTRYKYANWVDEDSIQRIAKSGTYTLKPAELVPQAYRIEVPGFEFQSFYLEYRDKTAYQQKIHKFDSGIPDSGLLIMRVAEGVSGNSGILDQLYVLREKDSREPKGNAVRKPGQTAGRGQGIATGFPLLYYADENVLASQNKAVTSLDTVHIEVTDMITSDQGNSQLTFTAAFAHTLAAAANDAGYGSVTIQSKDSQFLKDQKVLWGNSVTLTATANSGYEFERWNSTDINGLTNAQKTNASLTFTMPDNDVAITAIFKQAGAPSHSLIVKPQDNGRGTVAANTLAASEGTPVSVDAEPADGYIFSKWEAVGIQLTETQATANPLSFAMPGGDVELTAIFDINVPHAITGKANNTFYGSVTVTHGSAPERESVTAQADPKAGYVFSKWQAEGVNLTAEQETSNPLVFRMPAKDVNLTAVFEKETEYKISVQPFNWQQGTVSASVSSAAAGTPVTITATPAAGFEFQAWFTNSMQIDLTERRQKSMTFTMPEKDVEFLAFFQSTTTFEVDVKANDSAMGTVTPSAKYPAGGIVSIEAKPNAGYRFVRWESPVGNLNGNTDASLLFSMPANNVALTAVFEAVAPPVTPPVIKYTVQAQAQDSAMGQATANVAEAEAGQSVTVTADSTANFVFKKWESQGVTLSSAEETTNPLTITMPANNVALTAVFVLKTHPVEVKAEDHTKGSAYTSKAAYAKDSQVTVTATPAAGYVFSNWAVTGMQLSETQAKTNPTIFVMPDNAVTFTAVFKPEAIKRKITVSSSDNTSGTVVAETATAPAGQQITITAQPNAGYQFVNWTATGITLSADQEKTQILSIVVPDGDVSFTGNFKPLAKSHPVLINIKGDVTGGSVAADPLSANEGDTVTITASAAAGYRFSHWVASGYSLTESQQKNPIVTITMPDASVTFSAVYERVYPIQITNVAGGTATVDSEEAAAGDLVTLNLQLTDGYYLQGCQVAPEGLVINQNGSVYSFVMPATDVKITPVYGTSRVKGRGSQKSKNQLPKMHTVIFEANGGSIVATQEISDGLKVSEPVAPSKRGYVFTGWFTDKACTQHYDFEQSTKSKLTLYAGWSPLSVEEKDEHIAYISGYPDGTFRPEAPLTRGELAGILYRIMGQPGAGKPSKFRDIRPDAWYFEAVNALVAKGVISGYPDQTFEPDESVTRGEFVTMVMRFADIPHQEGNRFYDIPEDYWAAGWIMAATERNYISGYPDGTFKAEAFISRAEAVVIGNRILGCKEQRQGVTFSDVPESHWAYGEITTAATAQ